MGEDEAEAQSDDGDVSPLSHSDRIAQAGKAVANRQRVTRLQRWRKEQRKPQAALPLVAGPETES